MVLGGIVVSLNVGAAVVPVELGTFDGDVDGASDIMDRYGSNPKVYGASFPEGK